jgi:acyl carrier protein
MLEIEQEFAVQLGPEDMERMTSVAAIVEVLVAR